MWCCMVLVGTLISVEVELRVSVGMLDWFPTASLLVKPSTVKTEGWQVWLLYLHAMLEFIIPMFN